MGARCVQRRGTLHFREAIDRYNEFFVATLPEGCLPLSAVRNVIATSRHFVSKLSPKWTTSVGQNYMYMPYNSIPKNLYWLWFYKGNLSLSGCHVSSTETKSYSWPSPSSHSLLLWCFGPFSGHALHCQCFQTIQFFCELRIRSHAELPFPGTPGHLLIFT